MSEKPQSADSLLKNILETFGPDITVLSHDNYYKRHDNMTYEERSQINYDEPDAFDTDLMVQQLQQLRQGESVLTQYQETVKPMHEKYVEPSKRFADIIVPEGGKNQVALSMIEDHIRAHLSEA